MQINVELAKKINSDLTSLITTVEQKEIDRGIVLDRLNDVINNIEELNTIRHEAIEEYRGIETEWKAKSEKADRSGEIVLDYAQKLQSYLKRISTADAEERIKVMDEMATMVERSKDMIIEHMKNLEVDHILIGEILSHQMHFEFSKERKRWIWKNKFIFRKLNFLSKSLTILIVFSIGFVCEELGKFIFPNALDYVIGLSVAVISFLTLEKLVDKVATKYFWQEAKRETLILSVHYTTYAEQTIKILEFINAVNNIK